MKPIVSILIPVYNVEKYLRKCIESVINQTYKNLDIVLVDDGSTDNSGLICDEFALLDNRIKVYHNDNRGVSYSRNFGLSRCVGEYLVLLDSDDYVTYDYVELLIEQTYRDDYDLVICNQKMVFNDYSYDLSIDYGRLTGIFKKDLYILYNLMMGPVVKLYKMSIIKDNHITWPLGLSFSEDRVFNYEYSMHIKKYNYINKALYSYCHFRSNSLSRRRSLKSFNDAMYVLSKEKDFLNRLDADEKDFMICSSALFYARCFTIIDNDCYCKFCQRMRLISPFITRSKTKWSFKDALFLFFMANRIYFPIYLYKKIKDFM